MCAHLGTRYAETDQCDQCLERTARDEAAVDPRPCPECRAGKCGNCDGSTWDVDRDEYADCPCATAGHDTRAGVVVEVDDLLTARHAAEILDVSPVTVRSWDRRGHLPQAVAAGRPLIDGRGRKLYRWLDILVAERATRAHAHRRITESHRT